MLRTVLIYLCRHSGALKRELYRAYPPGAIPENREQEAIRPARGHPSCTAGRGHPSCKCMTPRNNITKEAQYSKQCLQLESPQYKIIELNIHQVHIIPSSAPFSALHSLMLRYSAFEVRTNLVRTPVAGCSYQVPIVSRVGPQRRYPPLRSQVWFYFP